MSKFFIQMFVSILVAVSAAVSFSPDVRTGLKETFHEANTAVRQTASVAVGALHDAVRQFQANASAGVDTKAQATTNADVKAKSNLEVQVSSDDILLNNVTPQLSVNSSSTVNSQANDNANTQNTKLDLKNKTKSTLDFSLDPLK